MGEGRLAVDLDIRRAEFGGAIMTFFVTDVSRGDIRFASDSHTARQPAVEAITRYLAERGMKVEFE